MLINEVTVTPEMAEKFLKLNTGNRTLREHHIQFIEAEIKRGKWITNADPVVVSTKAVLLNGQHRLHAIARAGIPCRMLVIREADPAMFPVMDRGLGRTVADATGLNNMVVSDATLIAHIMGRTTEHRVPPDMVQDIAVWWTPAYTALHEASKGKNTRGLSTSHFRVGYGLRWAISESTESRKYIMAQYYALTHGEVSKMSTATAIIWRRAIQGDGRNKVQVVGSRPRRIEMAATIFRCSNPGRANIEPYVKDMPKAIEEIADILKQTEAAYLRAAPGGHPYNYGNTITKMPDREKTLNRKKVWKNLSQIAGSEDDVAALRSS